jgi:hypothetical protein
MDIATGRPEDHPTPLPYDAGLSPGVAPPTQAFPATPGGSTTGAGMDTTGMFGQQRQAGEADVAAAQAAGMAAELDRRAGYHEDMLPQGADYGDQLDLPVVPDNAVPAAMSGLYPYQGDEPVSS